MKNVYGKESVKENRGSRMGAHLHLCPITSLEADLNSSLLDFDGGFLID